MPYYKLVQYVELQMHNFLLLLNSFKEYFCLSFLVLPFVHRLSVPSVKIRITYYLAAVYYFNVMSFMVCSTNTFHCIPVSGLPNFAIIELKQSPYHLKLSIRPRRTRRMYALRELFKNIVHCK